MIYYIYIYITTVAVARTGKRQIHLLSWASFTLAIGQSLLSSPAEVEHSQNLSTWISHDFSVCIYVLRGIAENATRAPPKLHKTSPKWNLQPRSNPARLFTQDVLSVTTKAQMTPHISFVHRNKYWNHSFNSISWHCLRKEMKTAL